MRDLISKRNGAGRGDMSAQFGIDLAKRLIRRAEQGLPVNPVELKLARQIVNGVKKMNVRNGKKDRLRKDSGQFLERDGAPVMFFLNWPHVSSF